MKELKKGDHVHGYRVLSQIGRGKFSVVYQAKALEQRHSGSKDIVALKRIRDGARCRGEVEMLNSLPVHENVVYLRDNFSSARDGTLDMVVDFCALGDLKRWLRRAQQKEYFFLEVGIWYHILQIASGLAHIHRHSILHRDLKPANVFLDTLGVCKIGDLGLGKAFNDNVADAGRENVEEQLLQQAGEEREGELSLDDVASRATIVQRAASKPITMAAYSKVGTPLYMAPEMLRGLNGYDHRADLWSFGCIIYELLTLRSPFRDSDAVDSGGGGGDSNFAPSLWSLFQRIQAGKYTPLQPDSAHPEVRSIVHSLLQVDVSQRLGNAFDICNRLRCGIFDRQENSELLQLFSRTKAEYNHHPVLVSRAAADKLGALDPRNSVNYYGRMNGSSSGRTRRASPDDQGTWATCTSISGATKAESARTMGSLVDNSETRTTPILERGSNHRQHRATTSTSTPQQQSASRLREKNEEEDDNSYTGDQTEVPGPRKKMRLMNEVAPAVDLDAPRHSHQRLHSTATNRRLLQNIGDIKTSQMVKNTMLLSGIVPSRSSASEREDPSTQLSRDHAAGGGGGPPFLDLAPPILVSEELADKLKLLQEAASTNQEAAACPRRNFHRLQFLLGDAELEFCTSMPEQEGPQVDMNNRSPRLQLHKAEKQHIEGNEADNTASTKKLPSSTTDVEPLDLLLRDVVNSSMNLNECIVFDPRHFGSKLASTGAVAASPSQSRAGDEDGPLRASPSLIDDHDTTSPRLCLVPMKEAMPNNRRHDSQHSPEIENREPLTRKQLWESNEERQFELATGVVLWLVGEVLRSSPHHRVEDPHEPDLLQHIEAQNLDDELQACVEDSRSVRRSDRGPPAIFRTTSCFTSTSTSTSKKKDCFLSRITTFIFDKVAPQVETKLERSAASNVDLRLCFRTNLARGHGEWLVRVMNELATVALVNQDFRFGVPEFAQPRREKEQEPDSSAAGGKGAGSSSSARSKRTSKTHMTALGASRKRQRRSPGTGKNPEARFDFSLSIAAMNLRELLESGGAEHDPGALDHGTVDHDHGRAQAIIVEIDNEEELADILDEDQDEDPVDLYSCCSYFDNSWSSMADLPSIEFADEHDTRIVTRGSRGFPRFLDEDGEEDVAAEEVQEDGDASLTFLSDDEEGDTLRDKSATSRPFSHQLNNAGASLEHPRTTLAERRQDAACNFEEFEIDEKMMSERSTSSSSSTSYLLQNLNDKLQTAGCGLTTVLETRENERTQQEELLGKLQAGDGRALTTGSDLDSSATAALYQNKVQAVRQLEKEYRLFKAEVDKLQSEISAKLPPDPDIALPRLRKNICRLSQESDKLQVHCGLATAMSWLKSGGIA
ncbi:unnamed protein product [Amoebophrya sp. A25]|nr:unnamed protein product [Amoebophrya sp. A25]|eukprot:GSA25T00008306001.1